MKKNLVLLIILSCFFKIAIAQNSSFGTVSNEELDMKNYSKDTSAHALVLREYGQARINVLNDDDIKLIFEYHVKIKIFDSKGFDAATVAVHLRNDESDNSREELENVSGTTYYKDANGIAQKADFDPKKIYNTRDYKYQTTSKFAMPGLVNGCVIEYKYTVYSPIGFSLDHFHPWEFQWDIPKIYSEYQALIPGHFTYNASLRGALKLTSTKEEVERGCFSTHGASSDCSHITYIMTDIPAFIEEEDMTSPKNFISAINFDLLEFVNPYTGAKTKATNDWKSIDYQLKINEGFGTQLKRKELLKDRILPVIANKTDDLEKAKAIYQYLQKWFKWNDYIGIYSDGLKKALDAHSGSVADINISLIAALNSAGINTEAVLLSTRDHGVINDLYPTVNDFNYIIAKANIGDKSYLLDATDPLLGFGMLPLKCLNDKGRAFSLDKPSYWIDLNLPQKERGTRTLDLTLQQNGKLKGTYQNYFFGYEAYKKRLAIRGYNSTDEYVEKLSAESPKVKILKSEIDNLDSLDAPLIEKYEVEMDIFNKMDNRMIFNPFFWDRISTNPFKLNERSYPVDWGMASDDRLILTVHFPDDYVIETPPPVVGIAMPNNGGRFLTDYQSDANSFTFTHVIIFSKSIYSSEEYPYLKELYNKIIQSEKTEMVFRKK